MMNLVNRRLRQPYPIRFALALLPLATISTVLTATAHSVKADQIRACENYGVVRDRSDNEVPLLPRRSVASCARSYQTLFQTYRVIPASPDSRVTDSNPDADATNAQVETPASPSSITGESTTGSVDSSNSRRAQ